MTYEYNNLGQKTRVLYQNGSTLMDVRYGYYANGWLKRVKNAVSKYTYDAVGNRTRTDLRNGTYTTYGYDTDPRYRVGTSISDCRPIRCGACQVRSEGHGLRKEKPLAFERERGVQSDLL